MKEKLEKYLHRHTQASIFLWMIVGGYLLYLAWQIFTSDVGEADPRLLTAAVIVFVIAGLILIGVGLYAMLKHCYKEPPNAESNDNEDKK